MKDTEDNLELYQEQKKFWEQMLNRARISLIVSVSSLTIVIAAFIAVLVINFG